MKKEKLPDGFPVENDQCRDLQQYPCDNCGKIYNYYGDGAITANSVNEENEEDCHCYGFCSEKCFKEFEKDNGLLAVESVDKSTDYDFLLYDEVKAELEKDTDSTAEQEQQPELIEPEEPPTCYEKKAAECWQHVVKSAQEISQAASKIVVLQDQLKEAKKEYDALVSRPNSYILTNGDSIQTTFADMDGEQKPEPDAEVVDTMA